MSQSNATPLPPLQAAWQCDPQRLLLAERVRVALGAQPALADVRVEGYEGGLIILLGAVPSPADRTQAVQTARQVVGVREVVDRMVGP